MAIQYDLYAESTRIFFIKLFLQEHKRVEFPHNAKKTSTLDKIKIFIYHPRCESFFYSRKNKHPVRFPDFSRKERPIIPVKRIIVLEMVYELYIGRPLKYKCLLKYERKQNHQ